MSSGFVTEAEAIEARKKRQEEWDRVRHPDDPEELPEEPYDSRSLFERLKEQKDKRDLDFEEAHKLKNMIRGLDDDEVDFLEFVDRTKLNAEKKQMLEEHKELEEFRQQVETLKEKSHDEKLHAELAKPKPANKQNMNGDTIGTKRLSQKSILATSIVLKKRKLDENNPATTNKEDAKQNVSTEHDAEPPQKKSLEIVSTKEAVINPSALKVIGVLPGLGHYNSDSSSDSDDDNGNFDWVGRKIKLKKDDE